MGESVVVEVLGGMVGPVTEGVLHGFTGIHDEGDQCGMRYSKVGMIWTREESCVWDDGVSIRGKGVLDMG